MSNLVFHATVTPIFLYCTHFTKQMANKCTLSAGILASRCNKRGGNDRGRVTKSMWQLTSADGSSLQMSCCVAATGSLPACVDS